MKKFILIVTILTALLTLSATVAFAQSPTPPDPSIPPTVPLVLVTALTLGISYLATQGVKSFSDLLVKLSQTYSWLSWLSGVSISGFGSWITGVVVTAIVFYLNLGFAALPVSYYPIVNMILTGLIAIFGANGLHATVKKFQPAALPTKTR